MTPAPLFARKSKCQNAAVSAAAIALLALGGCQALDKAAGVNKDDRYNPKALEQRPQDRPVDVPKPLTTEQMGSELRKQGLRDQALQAFEKAIEENPLAKGSYLNAGDIYFEKGDIATAQKRFEAAANLDPTDFQANYKNGLMLHLSRRVGEAVSAYLKALQINPYDPNANLNTGTAFLQLNEPQQAVIFAEKAVDLDKKNAKARANLGAVYAALGRHAEAVAQYREAAQLEELSPPLLLNLANSLGKMTPPQYGQMLNTLDEALRLDSSTPVVHERRAYALFKLNRREESMNACRSALSLDENYYPAWNIMGVNQLNEWLEGGKNNDAVRQEAMTSLRKSLSIEHNQPRIVELMGMYQ